MAFYTEKDLKLKNVRKKKVYSSANDVIKEENVKWKTKQFGLLKAYFLVTQIQAVEVKFSQNVHLITSSYLLPEKIAFSLHYKLR